MAGTDVDTYTLIKGLGLQTRMNEAEISEMVRVAREGESYAIGVPNGPENEAFEKDFAAMMGCADAVALSSCSSALELAANMSQLGPDDDVIIPAHTYVATAVPFARTGANITWADIDANSRVLSADSVRSLVRDQTRAVVAVHLYGMPVDMDAIMEVADEYGLIVVEDCAQAPGATYKGRRVGSIGDYGCFSFHSAKNITTLGEGGMLAVKEAHDGEVARRLRWMGNWPWEAGRERDWVPSGNNLVVPMPGQWPVNFCLSEISAAVGRAMLKRLDAINEQRRHQANRLIDALADYPELDFPHADYEHEHVYYMAPACYDGGAHGKSHDDLIELLRNKYKLHTNVGNWPLYRSELFDQFGFGEADVPEVDRFYDNMVIFPWWSDMPDDLIDDMASRTRAAMDELRG
ncbi:MAG: DegT/DnrJ/EryC1/StrS family aminotransferase [Phycisphaeraceae bacterium]|jgi:dTDP-4-amino-4,6-dideoxygalactose transaminase|nr:DegT/DnrJ/EryC1/StrS family aminotransferase [Phycisphaeraceae bacterium]